MKITHKDYHYSVTVQTGDKAVLYCLRALAEFSQGAGNSRIAWGGTKDKHWERDEKCVTFHFSTPKYRTGFLKEASRFLLAGSWTKIGESDQDPASPQK